MKEGGEVEEDPTDSSESESGEGSTKEDATASTKRLASYEGYFCRCTKEFNGDHCEISMYEILYS